MEKLNFFVGEKREITAVITSLKPKETVVIAAAKYALKEAYNECIVQNGSCEISGNEATVFLVFNQKGSYELEITVQIGREEIVDKTLIIVE